MCVIFPSIQPQSISKSIKTQKLGYDGDGRTCHIRNACNDEPCAPGMHPQRHNYNVMGVNK